MRSHVEKSKKYELDRFIIKKIYNKKEKIKKPYNISKKNVIYDKQLTEQYFKYSNNNRNNYYSSYQSFRDYISSGYNYDFLVNEINNVKSILGFSRNMREIINKKMNPEPSIHNISNLSTQNKIIELNEESNSRENIQNEDPFAKVKKIPFPKQTNENITRRTSTVFQIDKENPYIKRMADLSHKNVQLGQSYQSNIKKPPGPPGKKDFLEICKLLKIKEEEAKNPQNQYQFRLFSVLNEEFDPFYLPVYENFMNVKYENQKTKLIKIYNQEKAFIECVTLIKSKLKMHLNKDKNKNNNNMPSPNIIKNNLKNPEFNFHNFPQHKFQIKVPYINAFYLGRTESYFKDIDNFMSMYKENISLSTKKLEKDFFANLFKILTYNNTDGKKFLQYLYTHSYFFKYIYNIFTIQNKWAGMSIKNFAPSIKKHTEEEHFLNDSMKQLFFTEDSKNKVIDDFKLVINKEKEENVIKNINEEENEEEFDIFLGNDFIYKINLCEENVSDSVNEKKINNFKKILSNSKNFNQNFIITLNNNENMIQIINTKKNQKKKKGNLKSSKYFLSAPFDDKVVFYDLENDIKNNIKIEKDKKKSDKFVLIGVKQNDEYLQAYIFKLTKDIYNRFTKSILSKGNAIRKKELLGEAQESEEKSEEKIDLEDIINQANDADKEQKKSSSKEGIFDFDENDSEKNSQKKKADKDSDKEIIKPKIRKEQKQLTFGGGVLFNFKKDNLNESDKNDDNDDDNKSEKSNNKDSSDEAKSNSSDDDKNESDENEDDEDEDEKDDSEGGDDEKEENKEEGDKDGGDNDDSEEKSDKNNNKKESEIKNLKNEKDSDSENESSGINEDKNANEEEINTDINKNKEDKKNSIDDKVLSEKEDEKSNST